MENFRRESFSLRNSLCLLFFFSFFCCLSSFCKTQHRRKKEPFFVRLFVLILFLFLGCAFPFPHLFAEGSCWQQHVSSLKLHLLRQALFVMLALVLSKYGQIGDFTFVTEAGCVLVRAFSLYSGISTVLHTQSREEYWFKISCTFWGGKKLEAGGCRS